MEENTHKGCLIGCLSSVGILVGIVMLMSAMIGNGSFTGSPFQAIPSMLFAQAR